MPSGRVWNSGLAARMYELTFARSPIDFRLFAFANSGVTLSESESAAEAGLYATRVDGSAFVRAESTSLEDVTAAVLSRNERMLPEYSGMTSISPASSAGM